MQSGDMVQQCVHTVSRALSVSPDLLTGPAKGSGVIPRARALASYLASTECELSDKEIAKHFNRDRSSITHMLKVIEAIREHPEIDQWIDQVSTRALNPPEPCEDTLNLLITAQVEESLAPERPANRFSRPMRWGADRILAALAQEYKTTPERLISRCVPRAIRNHAWRVLYQSTTPGGHRIFTTRRIAELSGVSQWAVVNGLRAR